MVRPGRLVAVEGGSASGKTTLVRVTARRLGWRPLAEAVDRLDPSPSIEFASPRELLQLEETLLAEEVRRYREARAWCHGGFTVIADTGFLGPLTYTRGLVDLHRAPGSVMRTLERSARALVAKGALGIPDLTVYLRTTPRERAFRARSSAPAHPSGLRARHEAVGRVESRLYREVFPRLLPDRFRTLRAKAGPIPLSARLSAIASAGDGGPPSNRSEARWVVAAVHRPVLARRGPTVGPNR